MTTTVNTLREVVTLAGVQYALDEDGRMLRTGRDGVVTVLEEGDDPKRDDPKPTGNDPKQPPEPSEATRDMLKALSPEMKAIIQEYREWIVVAGSAQTSASDRARKIDELMLDFHLKAMKLPQAETAESKVARWFRDAGCGEAITEATVADIARFVRRGDEKTARAMVTDWADLARRSGKMEAARGVRTHHDVLRFVRS